MILVDVVVLLSSLCLLGVVSDRFVGYVSKLANLFKLSEMAAGFILLSVSTSLPELLVSVMASMRGEGGLSMGNVLGSNIANLTIVMGIAVIISGNRVTINEESQKELIQFLFLSSVIPLFVVQRGSLSLVLSVVLLILFAYFSRIVSKKASETFVSPSMNSNQDKLFLGIKWVISLVLMLVISRYTVNSSINIATFFGLPSSIIGATIVAFGTSLPELATTIQSFKKGLHDMALGNLIGSCIANLTLVLGASALVSFSTVNVLSAGGIMFFVLLSTMTTWYIISAQKSFGRQSASILILIYLLFILQELGFSIIIF